MTTPANSFVIGVPKPAPLPHPNEDVAFLEAREALAQYTATASKTRGDVNLSDIAKAEQIEAAYTKYCATISDAYKELMARRRARLEYLETLLPVGPGIPDGTSPADRAVLMTAFRTAYDQAQAAAGTTAREKLLAQAERFDDDTLRRAVFTALIDNNEHNITDQWAATHIEQANYLGEVAELREAVAGRGAPHMWDVQTFIPIAEPAEPKALPRLLADAQASRARTPGATITRH
ncbi:hypothetical protein [Streptomyces sp. NPDC003688]